MSSKLVICSILSLLVCLTSATTCNNAEIARKAVFTTVDGTIVSQIAFISDFSLKCSNKDVDFEKLSLYAEIDGRLTPVARIGPNMYQVSLNFFFVKYDFF